MSRANCFLLGLAFAIGVTIAVTAGPVSANSFGGGM